MTRPQLTRIAREVLVSVGALAGVLCLLLAVAGVGFGVKPLVFRSGSMTPAIDTGDLAFSRMVDASSLEPGDVVSVLASSGQRVTHRLVSAAAEGPVEQLTLRGDANRTPDEEVYSVSSVEKVIFSVPRLGYVVAWLSGSAGVFLLGLYAAGMLALVVRRRDGDEDDDDRNDGQGAPDHDPGEPGEHEGGLRRILRSGPHAGVRRGAVVVVATAALIGASPAWAFWTDTGTATASFSANRFFTCDAAIRGLANPWLYYKLDDAATATSTPDFSGNSHPGSYFASLTKMVDRARACKRDSGSAIVFDGVTNQLSSPSFGPGPNVFTIETWFKTTTARGGKLIGFGNAATSASSSYDRHLYLANDGTVYFGVYPSSVQTIKSGVGYNNGSWHQAVATLSSVGMRLYVDGQLVDSKAGVTTGQSYSGFWRIGYDNLNAWPSQPTSPFFQGSIDEVAVYTTALSADDVATSYAAGR